MRPSSVARALLRRVSVSLVAVLILAFLLVSVLPPTIQAVADQWPSTPDPNGNYAHCNLNTTKKAGINESSSNAWVSCQYGPIWDDVHNAPNTVVNLTIRINYTDQYGMSNQNIFGFTSGSSNCATYPNECVQNGDGLYQAAWHPADPDEAFATVSFVLCQITTNTDAGVPCTVDNLSGNVHGYPPYPTTWYPGGVDGNAQYYGTCAYDHSICTTRYGLDPVNTYTGSWFTSVTDASYPGIGIPFAFVRSYNSADSTSGPLGKGWTFSYNVFLDVRQNGDVIVHTEQGQQLRFDKQPDATFKPLPGVTDALSLSGGTYTLLTRAQVTYTFDSSGKLQTERDPNGQGLSFSFTGALLTQITDSVGRQITLGYTSGLLTSLTLPAADGRSVSYGYTSGQLTSVTDIRGKLTHYTYDAGGRLQEIKDQNNVVIAHTDYGTNGRVADQFDGRNHESFIAWDPTTETTTYTDSRSHAWKDVYNSGGELTQHIDPLGDTTTYIYNSGGNITSVTDAGNNNSGTSTINYSYTTGNLTQETDPAPLGYTKSWTYNSRNEVTSFTNGRGKTTRYEYDTNGNLTCILYANAPTGVTHCSDGGATQQYKTNFGIDPTTGLTTSMTDRNGNPWTYGYTSGNLTSIIGPAVPFGSGGSSIQPQTTFSYDSHAMLYTRTDPRGNVSGANPADYTWTYLYNNANQLTKITDPLTFHTDWGYDDAGHLVTVTDANGNAKRYEYDGNYNLSCVLYPDTTATTCATATQAHKANYAYDNTNDLISRTDGNGNAWAFGYDNANRVHTRTSPKSRVWTYDWWPDNLAKQTTLPSGGTVQYSYDRVNRLTGIAYSGTATPNVGFTYDGDNNRTQMTDGGSAAVNYVYDDLDRLTDVHRGTSTDPFTYTYTPTGDLKSSTQRVATSPTNVDVTTNYAYFTDRSLCWVYVGSTTNGCSSPPTGSTTFAYDPNADLTLKTLPNANTATMAYDKDGQLTSLTNKKGSTTLSSFSLALDGVGNPTQDVTNAGTINYSYDAFNRMYQACYSTCTGTSRDGYVYTYDPAGNQTTFVRRLAAGNVTTTYKSNTDDQLCWSYVGTSSNSCTSTPSGGTTYTFGPNGNMTVAGSITYGWDLEQRLTSIASGSNTHTYTYDGDGNRLSHSLNGVPKQNYLWDVNGSLPNLAVERNSDGTLLRRYIYGGDLLQMNDGSDHSYMDDPFGSVANVTSTAGTSELSYVYDPFGGIRSSTGSSPTNFMEFDSQFLNTAASANLYNLRSRQYDPATGRFAEVDPASSALTIPTTATYVYTLDRPTVLDDPGGACASQCSTGSDWGCVGPACFSDATHGFIDFWAGAGNFLTSTLTLGQVHIDSPYCGPGLGGSYATGEWTAAIEAVLASRGLRAPTAEDVPKPPGWTSDWQWRAGTRADVPRSWWDSQGGEWRWHPIDSSHPVPHWDYNPWTQWNNPWQRIYP
jgi:RHS repeat-associated protein